MSGGCISVRGARHHNLKNIDFEIPHHQLTVVTGLSGSGKSTLAFDTLYAEGQRRYVETFSPYTRQFLERMDKPQVDRIEGIPPAIAIEQSNPVKTTRSTVGTMTEIADHLKLLFPRVAQLTCPECGHPVRPYTSQQVVAALFEKWSNRSVLIGFPIQFPEKTSWSSAVEFLQQQGFLRFWKDGQIERTDSPTVKSGSALRELTVIQDRIACSPENKARLVEGIENAFRFGKGQVRAWLADDALRNDELRFSNRWCCPYHNLEFSEPTPSLFSFNNPVGACPTCRGFGRTIEIDYERALPDRTLSIQDGVVKPWQSGVSVECQKDLLKHCRARKIPVNVPFRELKPEQQRFVIEGELSDAKSLNELWEAGGWYGVKGYFQWLETKTYKMHVRVFLSRYRDYKVCPSCHGDRFQPQTLLFRARLGDRWMTLAELNRLSLSEAAQALRGLDCPEDDEATGRLKTEILTRLEFLEQVGLGYLSLDRATRTLSGGEIERVNLTSCLGNSLVNTLFVLDEPSIGLHPRDTQRLVNVVCRLRDRGNTVVVVEHEEAVMRQADHILDLGPGRGEQGGEIVFSGTYAEMLRDGRSLTGQYLSGKKEIEVPRARRAPRPGFQLELKGASENNLRDINVTVPLGLFVAVTGVSGSGKSTLVHDVIHAALDDEKKGVGLGGIGLRALKGSDAIGHVVRVDQSPLTKTPRSNAVLYLGAYDAIRDLFAGTEAAQSQGLAASAFSFNAGMGRCQRCSGTGFERIEMQFLSDVFVTCPVCEGKRFQNEILKIRYRGKSIHDVLEMTVREGLDFFSPSIPGLSPAEARAHRQISEALSLLEQVGLAYLRLGQPLNQLSGGEAQRIKLISYLAGIRTAVDEEEEENSTSANEIKSDQRKTRLFILDEPTTGLHFEDIRLLLQVFQKIVEQGDSLLVIEHNLEVIKCADWIIDLGPEAGAQGGLVIAEGTPEQVAAIASSHTGKFLRLKLGLEKATARLKEEPARRSVPASNHAIAIRGARHHNLKNLSLDLPLDEITVVTGLSGSGKSTLAFDLLFAEGQRRYLDSLNAYARQFVEQLEKPDVDSITGIPPAVAIEQRITRGGSKSTVSTVTEIYQFLRLLYAKLGEAHDPETGEKAVRQTVDELTGRIEKARRGETWKILAPLVKSRKGFHTEIARWAEKKGYSLLRVDGKWIEPAKFKALDRYSEHTIDGVIGELNGKMPPAERRRLIELALNIGRGTLYAIDSRKKETVYSTQLYCPGTGRSFDELDPRLFSFNSVHGWCPECQGYGTVVEISTQGETESEREQEIEWAREQAEEGEAAICPVCHGERLNAIARAVRLPLGQWRSHREGPTICDVGRLTIQNAREFFKTVKATGRAGAIARDILPEIVQRLEFLREVGLDYLTLDRAANTLSGGESQRIRLAAQLGSNLEGVLYVLDEPSIGLHPRDNTRLIESLKQLKEKGNTLLIVEHDEDTMKAADRIIDLGPGAGVNGGQIVAQGSWRDLARNKNSITGQILGEPLQHPQRGARRPIKRDMTWIEMEGVCANNLKEIDVAIPAGRFVVLCGVSGAGKSTLMHDVLKTNVSALLSRKGKKSKEKPVGCRALSGAEIFSAVYEVDQSPIGKTSRSTPATYTGLMDDLRSLFAQVPLARQRGYGPGRFSYNAAGGRCETCQGQGAIKVEMNFLPSLFVPCEACRGRRFNPETLQVEFNDKNIADVLEMSVEEAVGFFEAIPRLHRPLQLLRDTGLGYLTLGQRSPTLSGGEAQRIKLVSELARSLESNAQKRLKTRGFEKTHQLYLLEEPTIGLHLADVKRLLDVIHQLVDAGHTVVVIEHHLDVIAEADYVIELGPEGGEKGGRIVAQGSPEQVARSKKSPTAPFLKGMIKS